MALDPLIRQLLIDGLCLVLSKLLLFIYFISLDVSFYFNVEGGKSNLPSNCQFAAMLIFDTYLINR